MAIDPDLLARRDRLAARRSSERGEPPLPSLYRQAVGAVRTAARVVAGAARGRQVRANPDQVAARLAVCHACPGGHYRASDGRCGRMTGCGCVVAEKARLAEADCPQGYWPRA